jgi:hypothetical protein
MARRSNRKQISRRKTKRKSRNTMRKRNMKRQNTMRKKNTMRKINNKRKTYQKKRTYYGGVRRRAPMTRPTTPSWVNMVPRIVSGAREQARDTVRERGQQVVGAAREMSQRAVGALRRAPRGVRRSWRQMRRPPLMPDIWAAQDNQEFPLQQPLLGDVPGPLVTLPQGPEPVVEEQPRQTATGRQWVTYSGNKPTPVEIDERQPEDPPDQVKTEPRQPYDPEEPWTNRDLNPQLEKLRAQAKNRVDIIAKIHKKALLQKFDPKPKLPASSDPGRQPKFVTEL